MVGDELLSFACVKIFIQTGAQLNKIWCTIPWFYFALVFFNEDLGNLYTQIKEHVFLKKKKKKIKEHVKIAFIEAGDHILNMYGTLLFSHFLFKFV